MWRGMWTFAISAQKINRTEIKPNKKAFTDIAEGNSILRRLVFPSENFYFVVFRFIRLISHKKAPKRYYEKLKRAFSEPVRFSKIPFHPLTIRYPPRMQIGPYFARPIYSWLGLFARGMRELLPRARPGRARYSIRAISGRVSGSSGSVCFDFDRGKWTFEGFVCVLFK